MNFDQWRYCPVCGTEKLEKEKSRVQCLSCGLDLYDNPAACVGVIFCIEERIVMSKRLHDPSKGLYDFPGGFIDPGETAEDAAVREMKEELGINLVRERLCFLTTASNIYHYKGRDVNIVDIYFTIEISQEKYERMIPQDDVAEIKLFPIDNVPDELIAFSSVRDAIKALDNC